MNKLYIDSRMGINGIKLLGALIDMMEQPYEFIRQFNNIGFDGVRMERRSDSTGRVSGTRVEFIRTERSEDPYADESDDDDDDIGGLFSFGKKRNQSRDGSHSHSRSAKRTFSDVAAMISELKLSGKARAKATEIYRSIAEAASKTHGKDIDEVTLHRAGSRDVIASVVAVCMILEELRVDGIMASPVTVGRGHISGSAGSTPIPTPTVKELLGDIPYIQGKEEGELCTLEGAAILGAYASEYVDTPDLAVLKTGTGLGERTYKTGDNFTRVSVGRVVKTSANATLTELCAVLYNDSRESLRLTGEKLKARGVIEAYTIPISDLSGGGGVTLKCICPNDMADDAAGIIMRNTSAIWVSRSDISAYRMELVAEKKDTQFGEIAIERASGYGISKVIIDPELVEKTAREHNLSVQETAYRLRREK